MSSSPSSKKRAFSFIGKQKKHTLIENSALKPIHDAGTTTPASHMMSVSGEIAADIRPKAKIVKASPALKKVTHDVKLKLNMVPETVFKLKGNLPSR
jgi:hypothetical protein